MATGKKKTRRPKEEVKVLTPSAVDEIINQDVEGPATIAGEKLTLYERVKAWFKRKATKE